MSLDFYLTFTVDLGGEKPHEGFVFDANITHNLTAMWDAAGVYDALYMSEGKQAGEIIPAIRAGLSAMEVDPDKFRAFDSPNGWGTYVNAVPWLRKVLDACVEYPKAIIKVSK